jgi:cell division protein FtsI (penicillin-binding protein 3)
LAAAVCVVANGGTLYEPRLVRAVVKEGRRTSVSPTPVRTVIRRETAATLTGIMERVTQRGGTATRAAVPGFTVAGKTGTADKIVNGRYSNTQQNVSFVGFVPSRDPILTVIVMVDSPSAGADTGGVVAAPIFKRIAEQALRYLGVAPTMNGRPPVLVARRTETPIVQATAPLLQPVIVPIPATSIQPTVPDLRGLSARDAMRSLAELGLTPRLRGTGIVVDQHPQPGMPLEWGSVCTLMLDRAPQPAAGAHQP